MSQYFTEGGKTVTSKKNRATRKEKFTLEILTLLESENYDGVASLINRLTITKGYKYVACPEVLTGIAQKLIKDKKYERALYFYDCGLEIWPVSEEIINSKAELLEYLERYDEAQACRDILAPIIVEREIDAEWQLIRKNSEIKRRY